MTCNELPPVLLSVIVWAALVAPTVTLPKSRLVGLTLRTPGGSTVSVSVAELLAGLVSVTPAAAATVAVLTMLPVAAADMLHVAVKVVEPPAGRFTT